MFDISKVDGNFTIETEIDKNDIKFYKIDEAPFKVYGVFKENGKYRRMPEGVAKSVSEGVYALHSNTAGGRVKFVTDSPYIAIHVKMDGLGNFGIFTKIFLPLSLPALIAQILLWFIAGYNDYLGPLLYIGDEQYYTLQLVLKLTAGNADTNLPKVMAACVVVMAPILILYLVFQEYFLKGIALSSGKED